MVANDDGYLTRRLEPPTMCQDGYMCQDGCGFIITDFRSLIIPETVQRWRTWVKGESQLTEDAQ